MIGERPATPSIIVPLLPPSGTGPFRDFSQDIVVYLRPETNGVQAESALFRVFNNPAWFDNVQLVYLANLPGAFILDRRIVEQHYATRIDFARRGAQAFGPGMREVFQRFFGIPFEKAEIVGAFAALDRLGIDEEQLFQLWVPVYDILEIEGQLIKRTSDNLFIVNYDIPALLHKNHAGTDVAAMVFRTNLDYPAFRPAVDEIRQSLVREGLLDPDKPESRAFHYSKSPFEQLLDAQGYVYNVRDEAVGLGELAFGRFLLDHGVPEAEILAVLQQPLLEFVAREGPPAVRNLFSFTLFDSFETALSKFQSRCR